MRSRQPAGVAPLVVRTRPELLRSGRRRLWCTRRPNDGGIRIALEVGGHKFFFGVAEDAFHRAVGRRLSRRRYGNLSLAGLSTKT